MSLDVEGAELEVLRRFPFDAYCVRFMSVETNNHDAREREVRTLLAEAGYVLAGHAGVDDFFTREC